MGFLKNALGKVVGRSTERTAGGWVRANWKKLLLWAALLAAGHFGGAPAKEALTALLRALGLAE